MEKAFIYDAIRTPRGRGHAEKGSLKDIPPIDLLLSLFQALEKKHQLNTNWVEEVILGCNTVNGEQGANIAKIAALYADWSHTTNGVTVSSFCTSGLEAVQIAAMKVMTNTCEVAVAGGVESMSRVPMFSDNGAWFSDRKVAQKTKFIHMGLAADIVAHQNGFSKIDLNDFSLQSHQKAAAAWQNENYTKSVVPITLEETQIFEKDEIMRSNLTTEMLAALPLVIDEAKNEKVINWVKTQVSGLDDFKPLHSYGNAPGIADAASLILIGNAALESKINQKPIAEIKGFASTSVEPITMLTGIVDATQKVLQKANLEIDDIDLFEVNESFAAIPMMYAKQLNINSEKINVNGGAIAMGHPLGATGGILIGTLVSTLKERGLKRGIATICAGAGIAQATLIEIVD